MASLPAFHSFQDSPSYKPSKSGTAAAQSVASPAKSEPSAGSGIQAGPEKDLLVTQPSETKIPTSPKEQFFFYMERIPKKERTPEFQEKLFEFLYQGDQAMKPIKDAQRKVVAQHLGVSVESLTDEKLMAETGKILFEAPESKAAKVILKQNMKMGTQLFPRMQEFLKSLSPEAQEGIFKAVEDIQAISMRQLAPIMEKKFPGIGMAELQEEVKLSPKAQKFILETSPNVFQQYLEKGIKLLPKIFGEEQGKVLGSTFLGNVVNRIGNLVTDAMQGLLKFIR